MATTRDQLEARARNIRLVLLDVDGVLTDGTVAIAASGDEWKAFSIRDGAAIVWAKRSGLEIGLLSGRASEATTRRAKELNITLVLQGEADKRAAYMHLVTTLGLKDDQVAYMGDDLIDLPVLRGAPAWRRRPGRRSVRMCVYPCPLGQPVRMEAVVPCASWSSSSCAAEGRWDGVVAVPPHRTPGHHFRVTASS
jgi:YrbI family 3-deoxy-D-manno-octulosonate 8-phosphate phosphatase